MKGYIKTTAAVFSIVALLHLWRAVAGLEANIGNWEVPMWVSWLAVLVAGTLAIKGWRMKVR